MAGLFWAKAVRDMLSLWRLQPVIRCRGLPWPALRELGGWGSRGGWGRKTLSCKACATCFMVTALFLTTVCVNAVIKGSGPSSRRLLPWLPCLQCQGCRVSALLPWCGLRAGFWLVVTATRQCGSLPIGFAPAIRPVKN
jgi:hypothetical protein